MVYIKGFKSEQASTYHGFAAGGHPLGLDVELVRDDVVPVLRVLSFAKASHKVLYVYCSEVSVCVGVNIHHSENLIDKCEPEL